MAGSVAIINGDHEPPFPFVIVDRFGMHVDIDVAGGQLWDPLTVAHIEWGLRDQQNQIFGIVTLKNGKTRPFWDAALVTPYLNAYYAEREKRGHGEAKDFMTRPRPTQEH